MIDNHFIITIVTPSFNQHRFIEHTIMSVLSQKGNFYIDYIIVDGGSNDKTLDTIKKYQKLLEKNCGILRKNGLDFYINKKDFKWNNCLGVSYRWISEKDQGQADAINKGFRISKGDILAFINSDDVYYIDVFKNIIKIDWEKTDFIYGKGMWFSEHGRDIILYPTFKPSEYSLFYQCTLCQPTVFFKRTVFQELGDFLVKYQYVFDYEYWLRAIFSNKKFYFLNLLLAKSRMYKENKSISKTKTASKEIIPLLEQYYHNPGTKLKKIKLLFYRYTVHKWTVLRAIKMLKNM